MHGRRGHHEGSIFQRADGRWAAVVTLGYEAGKRKRKSFYGETRQEVQTHLTAALHTQQVGLPIPNDRLTLRTFLERWLTEVASPSIRAKTYRSYEQLTRLHLIPGLGHIPLARLSGMWPKSFSTASSLAGLRHAPSITCMRGCEER